MPLTKVKEWLKQEKELGCGDPERAVLATATTQGVPHSRIVALREISEEGFLFFTQRGTRKYVELHDNPQASMTFWFARVQRQIILDGVVRALSPEQNQYYWDSLPRERQLRFSAHASGEALSSLSDLEHRYQQLSEQYVDEIPMSGSYCGFLLIPETFYFYTLGTQTFSEVIRYQRIENRWEKTLVSP